MKNNVKGKKHEGMRKTSTFVKYDVFTTESLWKKWRRIIIRIDMWNGKKYKYFFFIHKFVVFCRDDNIINILEAGKGFTKKMFMHVKAGHVSNCKQI